MPDLVDNTAGITTVTGTAHYVISNSTGRHRNLVDVLTDGQIVSYYASPVASSVAGFEQGTAIWRDSTNTLEVQTITNSSNGGGKVAWGEGDKVVYIVAPETAYLRLGTTAATAAEGNDPRFGSVDIASLPAAATLTGAEVLPVSQSSAGVKATTQAVAGRPMTDVRGHALDRVRGYSDFSKTRAVMTITDGSLCDLEPYVAYFSGTGSSVGQGVGIIGQNSLSFSTGTTTTGYAAMSSCFFSGFNAAKSMSFKLSAAVTALPSAQAYTLQVGFIKGAPALAVEGMYFELDAGSGNFFACVRNNVDVNRENTGITAVAPTTYVFAIEYDAVLEQSRFYINGALVATIANATRVVQAAALLSNVFSIRKSAGTTGVIALIQNHEYNVETAAPAHY